ncbi:MAG: nucleotidyltransferase domain-containing protein [Candidatus Micrarchaeota archaeon]
MDLDKNSIFSTNWRMFYCLRPFQFDPLGEKYGLEIEREISATGFDISHETVFAYLNHYCRSGILRKKKRGRQTYFSVVPENAMSVLALLEQERTHLFLQKSKLAMLLTEISFECSFALLFGSAARSQERESSDVDILVVDGKSNEDIISKKEAVFGIKISIHSVSMKELKSQWHKEPVYKGIWRDRTILKNYTRFWELALKEGKP